MSNKELAQSLQDWLEQQPEARLLLCSMLIEARGDLRTFIETYISEKSNT